VPTYEYECGSCHRTFEVRQRISEPSLTTCDECGGPVHRLLSATPFILKGGGWYVTDYPSESRKKALDAEKSSSSTSDKSEKSEKSDKSDKSSKSEKSDKADKPAAATPKTDGAGPASTSGASAAASSPKSTD
jgi:putative FmdB family regulatory protein